MRRRKTPGFAEFVAMSDPIATRPPLPGTDPQPAGLAARFRSSRAGGVAILFALSLPVLLGAVGSAVDYTYTSRAKTKLDGVADIAALTGVKISSNLPTAAVARTNAIASFNANNDGMGRVTLNSLTITVTDDGLVRSSRVTYTATVQTSFMGLFGYSTMQIGGTSTASSNLPTYIDFYLLLDNSPSMGIGATNADIATMMANTPDRCGFACHDLSDPSGNYYQVAKRLNVAMRIDVVRQATQQLMDTARSTQVSNGQFRAAIYTYGASCQVTGLTEIASLTSNLANAKARANAIDLMTIPYQNYNQDQCTDNTGNLTAINRLIATPGDGSTAGSPQKVLMLVADGVTDANYPSTCTRATVSGGRCQEPLNPAMCETIKNRGIRIAVLYTTYLPLDNDWYRNWIAPFQPTIGTKMQACASPGLYFEVSPTQGIAEAMTALFRKAIATARLTQ
jgi:Flp pilus assembly protein TadG